ncbi:hypothetical protein HK096_004628, partial [Nowakowskiella sp. JEL0078]
MKEGSAFLFEMMNLYDDALLQYDELDASFFQTLLEQGAPWFQKFGGTDPSDDSDDIFNLKKKPYRELITQNRISIFDFRIYLFSRQCQILLKLFRPVEICQRAKKFITDLARSLHEYQVQLIPFFCESWVYSACMNVVSQCEELVVVSKQTSATMALYESSKAELLHYARMQLDILGSVSGLYTASANASIHSIEKIDRMSMKEITNPDLKRAVSSVQIFDDLYLKVTNRAVKSFEASNRHRSMWLLKGDIALLHFTRFQYAAAAEMWETMCFKYSANGWNSIDAMILEKLAVCQKNLNQTTKYIQSLLFLISNSELFSRGQVESWVDELSVAIPHMEDRIDTDTKPIFQTMVIDLINKLGDDDGLVVEVDINSFMPKEFCVEEITLLLDGGDQNEMLFQSSNVVLKNGSNNIRMICDRTSAPGSYTAKSIHFSIGKLSLHCDLFNEAEKPKVLWIHEIANSISVTLGAPDFLSAEKTNHTISFKIYTQKNSIRDASLTVTPMGSLKFLEVDFVDFVIYSIDVNGKKVSENHQPLETLDGNLIIPACDENSCIEFSLDFEPFQETNMYSVDQR